MATDIEKIEQALRENLDGVTPFTDADVMRYDHGGGRIAILRDGERKLVADTYHEADTEHFAICRPNNIRALLDELSWLRRNLAMAEASAELRLNRLIEANNELEELRAARVLSEREGQA